MNGSASAFFAFALRGTRRGALGLATAAALAQTAYAAEITTGSLSGSVTDLKGAPIADAAVTASSASGRYSTRTNAAGGFLMLGITPDTYAISVEHAGFVNGVETGVTVLAAQNNRVTFALATELKTIGRSTATGRAFVVGSTADTFVVSGAAAQARSPVTVSSGLATFSAGTVQGSAASAPGISFDGLGNVSTRGGKVDDTVFTYDSVPIPQGLVVDPGGNFVGAQTPTTGVGETTVTLAGYRNQSDNALGGIVNQVPLTGTYPSRFEAELGLGIGTLFQSASLQFQTASADLRSRLALATHFSNENLSFGDGHTFYPGEASVVGIGLQARGESSVAVNYHYALSKSDDLSFDLFNGAASYDQYGSPFPGQTVGLLDGSDDAGNTVDFPGEANQNAPVTSPSRTRGFFNVLKAAYTHTGSNSLERFQVYQSFFGARANGPFWDDNAYGQGAVSLVSDNTGHLTGGQFDGQLTGSRHTLLYGAEHRVDNSILDEIVPTNDEYVHSNPTLQTTLAYLGDTWAATDRLNLTGTGRFFTTHIIPHYGYSYSVAAIDPHVSGSYRLGNVYALRATYDRNTVPPKPLETDFFDNTNVQDDGSPAPFEPLTPERGDDITYSFEGGGRTQFRATYFEKYESNRIDAIPPNLRVAVQNGLTPSSAGIPGNVGNLRASGFELYAKNGGLTFDSNFVRAYSSSGSEFSYNGLNSAALLVGHLFPVSYLPSFSAQLGYEFKPLPHVRLTPEISYESGYPYGVGKKIWIISPADNKTPILVDNDNNVDPGANYYFLRDPSQPFDAVSNPYVGNLGTPEGDDPYSLRSPAQMLVNLHGEADVARRVKLVFDVTNLLGNFSPTQIVSNPYLIGPPGYKGGNATWAAYYGAAAGYPAPYTLGNGVPTNDGVNQILPWTFGTGGYVGAGWPAARAIQVRLRYDI